MERKKRLFRAITFKRKLIFYSILISTIPVLLVGLLASSIAARIIQEEVNINHQALLKQVEYRLNHLMENLNIHSVTIATNAAVERSVESGPPDKNDVSQSMEMIETLRKQVNYSPIRYDVSLIYKKFDYVYSSVHQSIAYTRSVYDTIFQHTRTNRNFPFVVTPYTYGNKELMLLRPVPLYSYYTEGVVALNVSIDELSKVLDDSGSPDNYRSTIAVVDKEGKMMISSNHDDIGSKLTSMTELYQFWQNPQGYTGSIRMNGIAYKLAAQRLPVYDWTIIAMTPTRELTKKSDAIIRITWEIIGALVVFWIFIAFTGSNRMYVPIERMLRKMPAEYVGSTDSGDGLKTLEMLLHDTIRDNRLLRDQINEHMPSLQENMSHHLLWGDMTDAEIRRKRDQFGLPLHGSTFRVCLVAADDYAVVAEHYRDKDHSLIHYALRKMAEEICETAFSCIVLTPQPGQVAVIVSESGTEDADGATEAKLHDIAADIRGSVAKYFKFTVSVAISRAYEGYSGIRHGYREALELSAYRMLMGPDVTITEQEVEPAIKQSSRDIVQLQKSILSNLIGGSTDEAKALLSRLAERIGQSVNNPETMFGIFDYLLVELDAYMHEFACELRGAFREDIHKKLHSLNSLAAVQEWLSDTVFPVVVAQLETVRVSKQERVVQHVLQSIHSEWDADLQQIARQYAISVPHLSRLFKEKTGEPFSDYLIRERMTKAQEWLTRTGVPVKEIAERLHYSTIQNFNRAFKQYTGMPPGEYRKRAEAGEQADG
ncbi:helix-turn-helix domain-containing protein [Paenibacillus hodogayensis]|uniref:Helix-turn-helix domain-containing protein n=1 Tax=Paenibacillus hodogayensis TaxID=279208 RepID=A0ABV5VVI8_9BACL